MIDGKLGKLLGMSFIEPLVWRRHKPPREPKYIPHQGKKECARRIKQGKA